jgi:catechol 2,3-dioxygenase-like lactoylglutathione lyase family enzyme
VGTLDGVRPKTLDHVALWVSNRNDVVGRATSALGVHVIERTDRFTLVGADSRRGKLTFFDAEGPRSPGVLERIGLRVSALDGGRDLDLGDGLRVRLVEAPTEVDYDLDHVVLRVPDPAASAARWLDYGFAPAGPGEDGAPRVEVGGAFIELATAGPEAQSSEGAELLNHLGVLVDSVEEHRTGAETRGIEIEEVVDAPNTIALFVRGPDHVRLEYIEHKPEFSLA